MWAAGGCWWKLACQRNTDKRVRFRQERNGKRKWKSERFPHMISHRTSQAISLNGSGSSGLFDLSAEKQKNLLNVFKWAAVISCHQTWSWKGENVFANEQFFFFFVTARMQMLNYCRNWYYRSKQQRFFFSCRLFSLLLKVDLKKNTIYTMLSAHFLFLLPQAGLLLECNSSQSVSHIKKGIFQYMNEPRLPNDI